jgi:hypothetical protein
MTGGDVQNWAGQNSTAANCWAALRRVWSRWAVVQSVNQVVVRAVHRVVNQLVKKAVGQAGVQALD